MALLRSIARLTLATTALVAGTVGYGQQKSLETVEAETALKAALRQVAELKAELAQERQAGRAMAERAAAASADAGQAREELAKTARQSELALADQSRRDLEKRLLDAVSDLRLSKQETKRLNERLFQVCEAALAYLNAPVDSAARGALEYALAENTVPKAQPARAVSEVDQSQIVSIKRDSRLIVLNAGERAGVKIGTPLRIYRQDRPLASAKVVEVRREISGALVTATDSDDFPAVGDSLRLDPTQH